MKKKGKRLQTIWGGEIIRIEIGASIQADIKGIICGFIIKNEHGLTILGDNTMNSILKERTVDVRRGQNLKASFVFTMPLLAKVNIQYVCL